MQLLLILVLDGDFHWITAAWSLRVSILEDMAVADFDCWSNCDMKEKKIMKWQCPRREGYYSIIMMYVYAKIAMKDYYDLLDSPFHGYYYYFCYLKAYDPLTNWLHSSTPWVIPLLNYPSYGSISIPAVTAHSDSDNQMLFAYFPVQIFILNLNILIHISSSLDWYLYSNLWSRCSTASYIYALLFSCNSHQFRYPRPIPNIKYIRCN